MFNMRVILFLSVIFSFNFIIAQPQKLRKDFTQIKKESLTAILNVLEEEAFSVGKDFRYIRAQFSGYDHAISSASSEEEFVRVINEVLEPIGIKHLAFDTQKSIWEQTIEGRNLGFKWRWAGSRIYVLEVTKDSEAYKKGMRAGDLINSSSIHIDKLLMEHKNGDLVWNLTLTKDNQTKDIQIVLPAKKPSQDEKISWFDKTTAYLKVASFDQNYNSKHIRSELEKCKEAKVIVLDLRNNRGGYRNNISDFADRVLPAGFCMGGTFSRRDFSSLYRKKEKEQE